MNTYSALLENDELVQVILIIVFGGLTFAVLAGLLLMFFPAKNKLEGRMESLGLHSHESNPFGLEDNKQVAVDFIGKFSHVVVPKSETEKNAQITRMRHAGFRSATALSIYYFIRMTGMLVLPVITLSLPLFDSSLSFRAVLPYALGAFAFGMVVPSFILDKLIEKRQRNIRNSLPDALDMLVITTEAGLGLNAALVRVASEIRGIHLVLSAELDMVNAELQAGVDRERALRNFYARTGVDEVKSLVGLINQSLKFGTSVASSLRMYADEFRQKRMQKAQEMAAKLGTKMIFPLAFCFMPCFFIVAVGPAVLKAIKVFSGP